jgi:hypothetical protein
VPETGPRSDGTKRRSHCTAAGSAPLLELSPTPTVTVAPGAPDPPETESDTVCDHAALTAAMLIRVSLIQAELYTTRLGLFINVVDPLVFAYFFFSDLRRSKQDCQWLGAEN